jgi:hypothetical protein
MKSIIIVITALCTLSPLYALGDDDFRIYKKPLLPWVEIAQTDTHTELIYKWRIIKRYTNTEFATELLPHGPDEEPDCYNSLIANTPSERAKNIVWKDYLRSCLVLETLMIRNRYILFYGPSVDGNRVSIYDTRTKKFAHAAVNNAHDVKTNIGWDLIFLTRNLGIGCQRSIIRYRDGLTTKLFDECALRSSGWPLIQIDSYRVYPKKMIIYYTPYVTIDDGNIVLDPKKKSQTTLTF